MNRKVGKFLAVLILIQLACAVQDQYDTTATGATTISIQKQDPNSFKYFVKRTMTGPSFQFESGRYVFGNANQQTKSTFSSTPDLTLKAVSQDYTCAVLFDGSASSQKLYVVDFTNSGVVNQKADLITTGGLLTLGDATKTFQVSGACNALKVDDDVYHYSSQYTADALPSPAWVKVTFNHDFTWAAANGGIYKYETSPNPKYSLHTASTFNQKKRIWTTAEGILVLTWVASGTTNKNNFTIKAFKIPDTGNATQIGTLSGQYYTTDATKQPSVSISQNLRTVVVYDKSDSTTFFAKGASISFTDGTITQFTIPSWITDTQSFVSVSDKYLFARNIVNNAAATPIKEVGSYFIAGTVLTPYKAKAQVVSADVITDWKRTLIRETDSGQLHQIRETLTSDVFTLAGSVVTPVNQVFKWDKTNGATGVTVSGGGASLKEHQNLPKWFLVSEESGAKNFVFAQTYPPYGQDQKITTYTSSDADHVLKAVSANYMCALVYKTTSSAQQLKIIDLSGLNSAQTIIAAADYSPKDPGTATKFGISNDCLAFRIDDKIFHYDSDTSAFVADEYPTGTSSLTNPIFNADFSLAITDTGIYKFVPKLSLDPAFYDLDREETIQTDKQIWQDGANYIVGTHTVINNTHFGWKVQLNTIVDSRSVKIGEFNGTVRTTKANIIVSPKLRKIIVQGISSTNANQASYVAKSIDWGNKFIRDITLPTQITGSITALALSDEFVYINNYLTDKRHGAWAFYGTTCIQAFLQPFPYPTIDYSRSIILADQTGQRKLVLGHQYNTGDNFIRLLRQTRKSVSEIINPNPTIPTELTFSNSNADSGSFRFSTFPYFGKWIYTTDVGTVLEYIEYNAAATGKKKVLTESGLTGENIIVANSKNMDCVLTYVTTTDLMTFKINSTNAGTITKLSPWANVVTTGHFTDVQVDTAITNGNVAVGANCWALRIADSIYIKNAAGDAFTRSAAVHGLTGPFAFDSSLNFVYAGGKVYKYSGTDYQQAFTVTGLKEQQITIHASLDNRKVILVSYQIDSVAGQINTVIKAFYFSTTWKSLALPSFVSSFSSTTMSTVQPFNDLSFETIGLWYQKLEGSIRKPYIYFATADYTTGKLNSYEIPQEWNQPNSALTFSPSGNYLHVRKSKTISMLTTVRTDYLYKIDKTNIKLILLESRPISTNEFNQLRGGKFSEQSGNIYAYYEYHQGTDVTVVKRLIGSEALQSTIKGIQTKDVGLLVQNGQIFLCPPGCKFCLSRNTCEGCLPGFVLDDNKNCLRCGSLCASCTVQTPNQCTTCINGYFKSQTVCVKCHDSCLTCSANGPSYCSTCKVGSYIDAGVCLACIDNCLSCTKPVAANDPLCDTCQKGYVYNAATKTCIKCTAGCLNCNPNKNFECLKCGEGYDTAIVDSTLTCLRCPDNCRTCTAEVCQVCKEGFRLVNNRCIGQCWLPCKECSEFNPNICTSCIGGYTLNGQTCNPDLSCNTPKTCTACPLGYNLVAGVCQKCDAGTNCKICESTNIHACATCVKGFYLTQTSSCNVCTLEGCADCVSESLCQQCRIGWVLSGASNIGKCLKCDESCLICSGTPMNCEVCAQGYTKSGWKCVSNTNIKLQLRLDVSLASFTSANYEALERDIATLIGKERNTIHVEKIVSGSVIVGMSISSNNQGQQAEMYNILATTLVPGQQIGGLPLLNVGIAAVAEGNVVSPDDSEAKRYRDIAIIVGVVIPVGLIILFIIFFILYKKGIICASEPTKVRDVTLNEVNMGKESSLHEMRK